mmetsp:Transcript_34477/g.53824  ORF Transcript_34477/g.53824 Transcript_34477/m.53824 type:complete len:87 (-) Transcript_34477:996-1256(-)
MASSAKRPEDEVFRISDRCLQRAVVRVGAGIVAGGVLGALLMRPGRGGRALLVGLGSGIGLGSSWVECQLDMQEFEKKGKHFPRLG